MGFRFLATIFASAYSGKEISYMDDTRDVIPLDKTESYFKALAEGHRGP